MLVNLLTKQVEADLGSADFDFKNVPAKRANASIWAICHMGIMGEDLIPTFRRKCDRALANLSDFTRPAQDNVQALMTLGSIKYPRDQVKR